MTAATNCEEMQKVVHESVSEIGLMEFMRLDQGAVLAKSGIDGDPKISAHPDVNRAPNASILDEPGTIVPGR